MIGRRAIKISRDISTAEFIEFMNENWNTETHNRFIRRRLTGSPAGESILLPASHNYIVTAYPGKSGGLFKQESCIILSVCFTPDELKDEMLESITSCSGPFASMKTGLMLTKEKERKGPAEQALKFYAGYMLELLEASSFPLT